MLAQRPGNGEAALVVATQREDVDDAISRLVRVELAATGAIVAILALVTFWVVRLGVRPIKRMTATASGIAAGDLSQRVPEGVSGTEAAELGTALNQMLGRIEEAFDERTRSEDRLRRFVGDASHELRTPVTTIRGYAELYRSGGLDDDDELREAMRRTEQEAIRMGALVDDLLLLARLDQGRPLERAPVELGVLAEDAVRDARAVDPERAITATVRQPARVLGDDSRLRQVVANLVRNAMVHTPEGTPVEVTVDRVDGRADPRGARRRPGHDRGRRVQGVRTLLSRRPVPRPQSRRHRPRAGDRAGHGRRPRRRGRARHAAGSGHHGPHRAAGRAVTARPPELCGVSRFVHGQF